MLRAVTFGKIVKFSGKTFVNKEIIGRVLVLNEGQNIQCQTPVSRHDTKFAFFSLCAATVAVTLMTTTVSCR